MSKRTHRTSPRTKMTRLSARVRANAARQRQGRTDARQVARCRPCAFSISGERYERFIPTLREPQDLAALAAKPRPVKEHARTGTGPVDGLRGLAILLVFGYHTWLFSWYTPPPPFDVVARTGYLGVDLFFLISGFCLYFPYAR